MKNKIIDAKLAFFKIEELQITSHVVVIETIIWEKFLPY